MGLARLLRWILIGVLGIVALVVGVRTWEAVTDPRMAVWHRFAPDEPSPAEIDAMDWAGWLAAEDRAFEEVHAEVTRKLTPEEQVPENRYWDGSPMYTPGFAVDWNRSFVMTPEGTPGGRPVGAAVLLHGLTDSPYSLRLVGEYLKGLGYAVVAPRMPGHGTVPGGLAAADWPQWTAATRLGVREARRLAPEGPLVLVGYSNGGALALINAMDALEVPSLEEPDRIVLLSPMVGVSAFARFSGLAALPALLPAFDRAAWFDLIPEYNPFKYNSFPVNGGRQSHLLTRQVQNRLARLERTGGIGKLAPVLTFQSVMDSTVSTAAVVRELYDRLPVNGSELVLYDVNRSARVAPLLRPGASGAVARLLPERARAYETVVIGGAPAVERVTAAGGDVSEHPLGVDYPRDIFSLSHIAVPFPAWDGLYGYAPDGREDFGISLGTMVGRGESGTLTISQDMIGRVSSNPFFEAMLARIGAFLEPR